MTGSRTADQAARPVFPTDGRVQPAARPGGGRPSLRPGPRTAAAREAGYRVTGIDRSAGMLAIAARALPGRAVQADAAVLPVSHRPGRLTLTIVTGVAVMRTRLIRRARDLARSRSVV